MIKTKSKKKKKCLGCDGVGFVQIYRSKNQTKSYIKPPLIKCEKCNGKGYIIILKKMKKKREIIYG